MDGPKSLKQLAKNTLVRFVDTITDVGDIEYSVIASVLRKMTSPRQLKTLEQNCPQIAGEDEELWKKFIGRDFGTASVDKYIPKVQTGWSRVYDKLAKEQAMENAKHEAELKEKMAALSGEKSSHKTRILPPEAVPALRRPRGSGTSNWGKSANNWNVKAGSKTKNIVDKARKEAKEASVFRSSRLAQSHGNLRNTASGVSSSLKQKIIASTTAAAPSPRKEGSPATVGEKRKREVVSGDEARSQRDEQQHREKTMEWMTQARERRAPTAPAIGKPTIPRKKAADPFFRPKKR